MKYFDWNEAKNEKLKNERDVSFEEVVLAIANNQLLDVLEHSNKKKYPDQKIFVVALLGYAYYVPFVESDETYFLKTIYPSRKATNKYLDNNED
ncbi:MAG: hypothetical protein WD022_07920 [Balneolaceae bacterium]